ncbi:hypothetical protein [Thioalkalivibrio sp.]|uniref:hypothetical protein n=1 Tax=Thioalkalivibrio sp. TaxID=2093813 RepID=UPI00356865F5
MHALAILVPEGGGGHPVGSMRRAAFLVEGFLDGQRLPDDAGYIPLPAQMRMTQRRELLD